MKIYEKYILNLLLSRFCVILLCVSIFGIFQEMAKGEILAVCSFWQSILILFIMLPFIIFQFLPFIYFGSLLVVLNELYSNNELICFKTIGLSHKQLARVFFKFSRIVLIFFVFLSLLYPATNRFFLKIKNNLTAREFIKTLQPRVLSRLGEYTIFFDSIDKHSVLHNVSIFTNFNNKVGSRNGRIMFSKTMTFGYNNFDEFVVRFTNSNVLMVNFNNKDADFSDNVLIKRLMFLKETNVLFDDFFKTKKGFDIKYKQKLRTAGLFKLTSIPSNDTAQENLKKVELYGRIVLYWLVILTTTSVCCLLLTRKTNRFSEKTTTTTVILLSSLCCLSRAFFLEFAVAKHFEIVYFSHFVFIFILCVFLIVKSDKMINIK